MKSFLERWMGGSKTDAEDAVASVEPGQRVYCIGDVHGRHDLLQQLHGKIEDDARSFEGVRTVIYLGDLIDRGMQSSEVIDELISHPLPGFETVHLMGNHEHSFLDFIEYPVHAAGWLNWGGRETLASYGVGLPTGLQMPDVESIRDDLLECLPPAHVEFFRGMSFMHRAGGYLFVHAGIRPGVALQDQKNSDLLWIRNEFLESRRDHGVVVVHGHSINEDVEMRGNRIGIDTGAYYTGVLTCLVLEGSERRLLQTGMPG